MIHMLFVYDICKESRMCMCSKVSCYQGTRVEGLTVVEYAFGDDSLPLRTQELREFSAEQRVIVPKFLRDVQCTGKDDVPIRCGAAYR